MMTGVTVTLIFRQTQRHRSQRLKECYGPEYERQVAVADEQRRNGHRPEETSEERCREAGA
jgi:hypothetical protein